MPTQQTIALFGLGSMGYGMACSLLRAGHTVYGFDPVQAQVDRLQSEGSQSGTLDAIASAIDTAVIVVLNAVQTESVLFGANGLVPAMQRGACIISCATMEPATAHRLSARCAEHGIHYLDAPISGGAVRAAQGELSIMASGTPDAFTAAKPALDAMAARVFAMGDEAGAGSAMKAVNQLLAGVHIAAMGEAMTFGMQLGIAPERIVEVISASAGNSWMFENRAPHVVAGDYSPHSTIDIWPKDLGIVQDIAKSTRFSAPLSAAALQQFLAASGSGLGSEDDAAVAKVYARNCGLTLPGDT